MTWPESDSTVFAMITRVLSSISLMSRAYGARPHGEVALSSIFIEMAC